MAMKEPLRHAYLALSNIQQISIRDTYFDKNIGAWVIFFGIEIEKVDRVKVNPSFWYCLVDSEYPYGPIRFYPASDGGIKETYFHQSRNTSAKNVKWTDGKLCLDFAFDSGGRRVKKVEQYGDPNRLFWHFSRAVQWVNDANNGTLIQKGDPLELPDFNVCLDKTIGFVSSPDDLGKFSSLTSKIGFFEFLPLAQWKFPIATTFYDKKWVKILDIDHSAWPKGSSKPKGLWIFLKSPPVIQNWQSPSVFPELIDVLAENGFSIDELLKITIERHKNNEQIHYWAFGFPIEEKVGEAAQAIHWQFLQVPKIDLAPVGFRNGISSLIQFHKNKWNSSSLPTLWIRSINVHPKYLFSRIPEAEQISQYRFLIVGMGSLGSILAESLVRSGAMDLVLYDQDTFVEGNLCRHTLKIDDLGRKKATAMADSLRQINPFLNVSAHHEGLNRGTKIELTPNTVVIDTTSEDWVIHLFEQKFEEPTVPFFSFSFGVGGNPIFCYSSPSKSLKVENFKKLIAPHLVDQPAIASQVNEGIGCWNPVFPCTVFSIQNAAHICFQFLKNNLDSPREENLSVFESEYDEKGDFIGTKRY